MDTYEIDHGEHPADVRYDMGLTAYPVQQADPVGTANGYHDYDWGVLPDGSQASARSMYPVQDVMEPQYGSYALGYAPLPPTADLGVMTAMQTYIPPSDISFSTPLSHMPYQGHENYYGSNFSTISPTSTTSTTSSGSDGRPTQKAKRKRVQSTVQRKAANVRERRRMYHLNEAFDELRKRLPAFNYEKRLSRIETLKLAMTYIGFMKGVSDGKDPKDVKLIQQITSDFSDNESD